MPLVIERLGSSIVRLSMVNNGSNAAVPAGLELTSAAQSTLVETISAFVGPHSDVAAFHTEIDLRARPPRYRKAPNTPVELYESRMAVGDLLRPLFLPPLAMEPLRPFQKIGVAWLLATRRGVLADDMGLGKTVQAIFALRHLVHTGQARQALVACPGILIPNWLREFDKWAPELGVCVLRPPAQIRAEAWRIIKGRMHVVLATYEQIRAASKVLDGYGFDVLVLDEAHRLRNPRSKTADTIRRIDCGFLWALTGTPIERHSSDLVAILSIVAPGRVSRSTTQLGESALRSIARPYLLRRHKRDVLADLPRSDEQTVWLDLTPEQRRAYDLAVRPRATESPLARLARLRKICDIEPESRASAKIDFLVDRAEEIVIGLKEKAVVFSL